MLYICRFTISMSDLCLLDTTRDPRQGESDKIRKKIIFIFTWGLLNILK